MIIDRDLLTSDDIIKKVAKDTGEDVESVKEVFNNNLKYIKHLTKDSETLSIRIPFIGVLYFNINLWLKTLYDRKFRNKAGFEVNKYVVEIFERSKPKVEIYARYERELNASGRKKKHEKLKHRRRPLLKSLKHTGGKKIDEIEKIQNEFAEDEKN